MQRGAKGWFWRGGRRSERALVCRGPLRPAFSFPAERGTPRVVLPKEAGNGVVQGAPWKEWAALCA